MYAQTHLTGKLKIWICFREHDAHMKLDQSWNLQKKTHIVPHIDKIKWRVDFLLTSSKLKDVSSPSVELCLHVRNPLTNKCKAEVFEVSSDKLRVLHHGKSVSRSITTQSHNVTFVQSWSRLELACKKLWTISSKIFCAFFLQACCLPFFFFKSCCGFLLRDTRFLPIPGVIVQFFWLHLAPVQR